MCRIIEVVILSSVILKRLDCKVVFLKLSILAADTTCYYSNEKNFYGSSPHFQEDSNALKNVLFGYCMNKL
jgi:hypothetical protein